MDSHMDSELYNTAMSALPRMGVGPGIVLLDFGARIGNYAIPALDLVGEGGKVVALDNNAEALEELRENASTNPKLKIVKTEGELDLPFQDDSFDMVLFFDVIQHVSDPLYLLDEFARVLKSGGRLAVYIPHEGDIKTVMNSPFTLLDTVEQDMVHWDRIERGTVYVFKSPS